MVTYQKLVSEILKVLIPVSIGSWISYVASPSNFLYIISYLISDLTLIALIFRSLLSNVFLNYFWRVRYKIKLRNPTVAILQEEGCEKTWTQFIPEDWYEYFSKEGFNVKYIKAKEITNAILDQRKI